MNSLKNALYNQLAKEYNCEPEAFEGEENRLTVSVLREGRRIYDPSPTPPFFHMATVGRCAVVTADEQLHPFLRGFIAGRTGHWLFEQPNLRPLEEELNRRGYTLMASHHMFLPCGGQEQEEKGGSAFPFPVKWFYDEEIHPFYGNPAYPNAICESYQPHCPDRIVVCAYDGNKIVGMAGCSEDAPGWMQIGIDVLPSYRSRGIGRGLVSMLKDEIERRGDIPFYGTSLSNLHSQNIAIACGFRPAWVEIGAKKRNEA